MAARLELVCSSPLSDVRAIETGMKVIRQQQENRDTKGGNSDVKIGELFMQFRINPSKECYSGSLRSLDSFIAHATALVDFTHLMKKGANKRNKKSEARENVDVSSGSFAL